jgi:glycosyltransferase involved in cell wall biosynthesis
VLNSALSLITLEESTVENLKQNGFKSFWIPYELFSDPEKTNDDKLLRTNNEFVISTVGVIYEGKNIDFIINTLKNKRIADVKYIISGFPYDEYGQRIKKEVEDLHNEMIEGHFEYLSEEEYTRAIKTADFIVLSYSKDRSDQASGVFFDAIKYNRPVIAPNVEPFKYYIEKYKIGLMFEENDEESFVQQINMAKKLGTSYFIKNINDFKRDFSYDVWIKKFVDFLKSVKN